MADKKNDIINATGRRKTATACVNLIPGTGEVKVNGQAFDEYFDTPAQRIEALQPLLATDNQKKFNLQVRAHGGGLNGQAGATSMAIARALVEFDSELRPTLKAGGFLRRDSRMKERKKSGQPGARKRFQFSKR